MFVTQDVNLKPNELNSDDNAAATLLRHSPLLTVSNWARKGKESTGFQLSSSVMHSETI